MIFKCKLLAQFSELKTYVIACDFIFMDVCTVYVWVECVFVCVHIPRTDCHQTTNTAQSPHRPPFHRSHSLPLFSLRRCCSLCHFYFCYAFVIAHSLPSFHSPIHKTRSTLVFRDISFIAQPIPPNVLCCLLPFHFADGFCFELFDFFLLIFYCCCRWCLCMCEVGVCMCWYVCLFRYI